jgi:hypothetical protein
VRGAAAAHGKGTHHACGCARVRAGACVSVRVCACVSGRMYCEYAHTHRARANDSTHLCRECLAVCVCVLYVCVQEHLRISVFTCLRMCAGARAHVCGRACMHARTRACAHHALAPFLLIAVSACVYPNGCVSACVCVSG